MRGAEGWKVNDGLRALVVDPEPANRRQLRALLAEQGYRVVLAATGDEALEQAARWQPDLIILDLVLPDLDGLAVCRELREWTSAPIVVISYVADEQRKIAALDHGADDYLTRPFQEGELLARLRVALRRAQKPASPAVLRCGPLQLDQARRRVMLHERELALTPTEYTILRYLLQHVEQVVTYPTLVEAVWGSNYRDGQATLRVYIAQLRRKLETDPARPVYIRTEPRVGYRLCSR